MKRLTIFKNSLTDEDVNNIVTGKMQLPTWLVAIFDGISNIVLWDYENDHTVTV